MVEMPKHSRTRSRMQETTNYFQKTLDTETDYKKKEYKLLASQVNYPKRVLSNSPHQLRSFQYNTKITQALL